MEELQKYRADFNEIVETVDRAYRRKPLQSYKKHLIILYRSLVKFNSVYPLERSDIEQELAYRWILFSRKYHQAKPSIGIRSYLVQRSMWAMRDWFRLLMRQPVIVYQNRPIEVELFRLDFKFLVYGTEVEPFNLLTP